MSSAKKQWFIVADNLKERRFELLTPVHCGSLENADSEARFSTRTEVPKQNFRLVLQ